ncbi:spermatogenesis-associated protein 46 isoform X3 [Monodelphis domestica]|uniref:spermatogenesis-associated protein 46 isoform X3 n=1 Tax=Monodelphis domestica TaxID=13616 RepID=UPI0024E1AC78|nr:spermatogenesis-associated protein 46 isoform X3 [Monodelphis domestica]
MPETTIPKKNKTPVNKGGEEGLNLGLGLPPPAATTHSMHTQGKRKGHSSACFTSGVKGILPDPGRGSESRQERNEKETLHKVTSRGRCPYLPLSLQHSLAKGLHRARLGSYCPEYNGNLRNDQLICKSRHPKMFHLEGMRGHRFQPFNMTDEDNGVQNGEMTCSKTHCYLVTKRGQGSYPQFHCFHYTLFPRMSILRPSKLPSISGPRISSSAMNTFPDITSSRATSLPDISKTPGPAELSSPAQVLPPQYQCSALRHGVHNTVFSADCALGDTPSTEQLRRNCTIYRPWFSPYSYFVCTDKESHLETYSFPEKPRPGLDSKDYITSQDILTASKWHPAQQNGYKCVACCRMYPTLHSLKSHIKGGFKEGFSCKVYYRKLKTLWGKEQKARPGDRISNSNCQTFK